MPRHSCAVSAPVGFLPWCWPSARSALSPLCALHMLFQHPEFSPFWALPWTPDSGDNHGHALPAFELFLELWPGQTWRPLDPEWQEAGGWCEAKMALLRGRPTPRLLCRAGGGKGLGAGCILEKLLAQRGTPGPFLPGGGGGVEATGRGQLELSSQLSLAAFRVLRPAALALRPSTHRRSASKRGSQRRASALSCLLPKQRTFAA